MTPALRPVEGHDANDELASLAKAIGHPARVQILRILQAGILRTPASGAYYLEPATLRRLRALIGEL